MPIDLRFGRFMTFRFEKIFFFDQKFANLVQIGGI